ncbi:MAG: hypothetical protein V4710_23275 [Verrucomicrobiota bacterium]
MKQSAPESAAAATVSHRGVLITIYGPLKDRKKPVYLLCYHVGSRREKCTAKGTLDDARRAAKKKAESIAAGDLVDALHLTPLDRRVFVTAKDAVAKTGLAVDVVCRDAAAAIELLGSGISLAEAAKFYKAQHVSAYPSATPAEIALQLYEWMIGKRRKATTIRNIKSILKVFGRDFTGPISSITTQDLDRWLSSHRTLSPRTLHNYVTSVVQLFNFAKGRYLPLNISTAADRLEPPSSTNESAVAVFAPWEMEKILRHAPVDLIPCIVLGGFAGVRTIELTRVEWSAVHFEASAKYPHGYVEISAVVAKQHRTAQRRLIPMSENLAAWLLPYKLRSGKMTAHILDSKLSEALSKVIIEINKAQRKAKQPLVRRQPNGLRHSFGSYRLPVLNDVAALSLEMNTSVAKIYKNYRELVPPADVEAWWRIMPLKPGLIIPIDESPAATEAAQAAS